MSNTVTHRHMIEQWKQYPLDRTGYLSDELPVSNKSLIRDMLDIRANEIRTALFNGVKLSEYMVQTIDCIKMKEVDRAEHPSAPASGCYWLKSEQPIPIYIKMMSVTGVVVNSDMPRFDFIKWDRFQYIPKSRSATMANGRYWTIRETSEGPYLYLYGDRFLETVALSGIWEDPISVDQFPRCGVVNEEAICNPLDVNFYTDAWLRKLIIARSWETLLAARNSSQVDIINDDKSVTLTQGR